MELEGSGRTACFLDSGSLFAKLDSGNEFGNASLLEAELERCSWYAGRQQ